MFGLWGSFFFQLRNVTLYKDLSTSWITHSKSRVKWTPFDKYYLSTFDTHRILLLMNVFSVNGIILTSDGLITARFKAKSMIHWYIIENPSKQHHILWMYGLIECAVHRLIKWESPRRVMLSGGIIHQDKWYNDTTCIHSNRRVFISSTCIPPWWTLFPSRNFVLIYIFIYTYAFFIRVLVIVRIYSCTGSVVRYWWSCTPSQ